MEPVLPAGIPLLGAAVSEPVQYLRKDIEVSKGTKVRTLRVEDELWIPAQEKAKENNESLSDIMREALRKYLAEGR